MKSDVPFLHSNVSTTSAVEFSGETGCTQAKEQGYTPHTKDPEDGLAVADVLLLFLLLLLLAILDGAQVALLVHALCPLLD